MSRLLIIARRSLLGLWIALVALVLALVVTSHVAGQLGYRIVIIRGSSMTPTIPLGSLAFEQAVPVSSVAVGDVVTLGLPHGTVVTHRVVRTATVSGEPFIETKGDANAEADATLQAASTVTGVVRFHVPFAGFLLAFLGIPSGILSVVSMLGSLLAAIWLMEELESDQRTVAPAPDVVGHGVPA